MEITTSSTEETKKLASELAEKIEDKDILALYGDLGAGKTTFTRFLVEALGSHARVQSPTFVIHRKYFDEEARIQTINHIDLYRLNSQEEAEDLGISEIFEEENAISVIEWPEIIEDILPEKTIKIYFEYIDENERKIKVENLN